MTRLLEQLERTLKRTEPVLLLGERGSGKGALARGLHAASPRAGAPFVEVNCAAIPRELVESELFGHEEGAFTGAKGRRRGRFEAAHKGTLFLDEIGDLPLDMQAKLLTVVETRRVLRLGGTTDLAVDVRLVAATNRDVAGDSSLFRPDLLDRLSVFRFDVPPLRDRSADIPLLAQEFFKRELQQLKAGSGGKDVPYPSELPQRTLELFARHPWPGNVRELRDAVTRLVTFSRDGTLDEEDTRLAIDMGRRRDVPTNAPSMPGVGFDLNAHLEAEKRRFVDLAMETSHGNVTQAARLLGMSKQALHQYLKTRRNADVK
jgi:DNA-binding NtrC family response regulator